MSHVEPEHNRPQEGEEPDEPFKHIMTLREIADAEEEQAWHDGTMSPEVRATHDRASKPTAGEHDPVTCGCETDDDYCPRNPASRFYKPTAKAKGGTDA